jgi:hypothetical protein
MTPDDLESLVVRMQDELVGLRRRIDALERQLDGGGTIVALPPPPPRPTRTDPYRISDMDDEPTRREKRPR